MRFCREYQGSAIPQRRNDQFCGIRYGWASGLTRMHDGQAQDFVPLCRRGYFDSRVSVALSMMSLAFRAFTRATRLAIAFNIRKLTLIAHGPCFTSEGLSITRILSWSLRSGCFPPIALGAGMRNSSSLGERG